MSDFILSIAPSEEAVNAVMMGIFPMLFFTGMGLAVFAGALVGLGYAVKFFIGCFK